MAEAVAVVSIVANIIQLVEFGSRVLKRLEEYQSKLGDIPEAFRHVKTELPVLLDALRQTQSAIDAGSIQDESKKALLPAVEGCGAQIRQLDDVIAKALPALSDSWIKRGGKAFRSLRYDAKVERITVVIQRYIQTLTYHAAVSLHPLSGRTLSHPIPSSTVPFRRDPHFVDRQILAEIDCKSLQPASRLALVGLGGVGKSQLAVEHSFRIREKSPATWVFWVYASSTARFIEGYRKIAERVKLPRWDQPGVDILMLVYNWLCDEANGRWLMIIDNADDVEVFTCRTARVMGSQDEFAGGVDSTLLDSIPQSSNGSILITSRSRDVAFRLTGAYADIIRVNPMDQAHALTLLRNQLKGTFGQDDAEQTSVEKEDAAALVDTLDYMPLAISQAAAYINQRAPRATVSRYLHDLRKGDRDRAKLLQIDLGDTRRDGTASNSIITTWQISFEYIRKERPSATRLLSLMSLFNRQGIPESLLSNYYESSGVSAEFEDDLNMLLSFSLVATDIDGYHFQMHRLIQFSTIKWLEIQGDLEGWIEKYVTLLDGNYPDSECENWEPRQALFPHAQAAVAYRPTSESVLETWASVLSKAMMYAYEVGYYKVAQEMGQHALEAREITLGAAHPYTLSSLNRLGVVLRVKGKYEEAELMLRRALQGREKAHGPEHGNTLASMDNLGLALGNQGKLTEAETMHRRALEGSEKRHGKMHPDTLICARNLACVLGYQARYDEAEFMHRRVLDDSVKVLGEEHPFTLFSFCNLGSVLHSQGKDQEAEAMHRKALASREKVLGKEHPYTLSSMHNLAKSLKGRSCDQEALSLMKKCFQLRKQTLGPLHPDTKKSFKALYKWTGEDYDGTALEVVEGETSGM